MNAIPSIGPLEGMNYLGRQSFETSVKDGASRARSAMIRACERRGDDIEAATTVVPGAQSYRTVWKLVRHHFVARALFAMLLASLCAADIFLVAKLLSSFTASPMPEFLRSSSAPIALQVFALSMLLLTTFAASFPTYYSLRYGFWKISASSMLERLSTTCWVIGSRALHISASTEGRVSVSTVFYDAIGSVDVDEDDFGLDVVIIRSRDGSLISKIDAPVTSETDNARAIADAIYDRVIAARK
jgi:hypothetical protein